jgi:phenylalanyl-tRNA synthetase alpha chain
MSNSDQDTTIDLAKLELHESNAIRAIESCRDLEELKEARIQHIGDKSPIALANRDIGKLLASEKASAGARIGEIRQRINTAIALKQEQLLALRDQEIIEKEKVDVTLAVNKFPAGAIHPLTAIMNRIADIFVAMGYEVAEGPEAEAEWFNFDALNIPKNHPARSMQDTFYVESQDSGVVLRTQTSPVQIRSLLSRELPVYVISPGKVFRTDELDQTHTPVFHQVEGLVVDKGIGMPHLKATIDHFAKTMFGNDVKTRLRPSYFPFTEPSAEIDIFFNGRWIEWGGCGVVNPKVLQVAGIDTETYSGFAFGMGVERTLMFRNGVTDMRDMVEGDIRFSKMFGVIS